MSSFNCIPNGCARVVWTPYRKRKSIRYRYDGEEWTTIIGDDYSTNKELGKCPGAAYRLTLKVRMAGRNYYADGENEITCSFAWFGTFEDIVEEKRFDFDYSESIMVYYRDANGVLKRWAMKNGADGRGITMFAHPERIDDAVGDHIYLKGDWEIDSLVDYFSGETDNCGDCTFEVYRDDRVVIQEIRSDCPEVEVVEEYCELADTSTEIKIDKVPALTRVEVVPFGYTLDNTPGLPVPIPFRYKIPEHCLNVYRNDIYLPVPPEFPENEPGSSSDIAPIEQICSSEGCQPPQFEVICDCDCRGCPEGSCGVPCGDTVCCNDTSTGKLIETIPVEEYCEGGS